MIPKKTKKVKEIEIRFILPKHFVPFLDVLELLINSDLNKYLNNSENITTKKMLEKYYIKVGFRTYLVEKDN